eukprot:6191533-Pleurochrysis_carterae.AAC.8
MAPAAIKLVTLRGGGYERDVAPTRSIELLELSTALTALIGAKNTYDAFVLEQRIGTCFIGLEAGRRPKLKCDASTHAVSVPFPCKGQEAKAWAWRRKTCMNPVQVRRYRLKSAGAT